MSFCGIFLNISIFSSLLLHLNVNAFSRVDPLVDTKVGLIRGLRATDGDYSMFLGIPYALVDEANPFGPSIPFPQFEDAFEAYHDSVLCPQMAGSGAQGTLDCLQLNIYVPSSASSNNRLPVLVWIHGGAFTGGSAQRSGPKYLVRHDVILVTLHYRLGPYGFMCVNNPDVSGNQGLKDQLTALRWINENIGAFGGDISRITLSGQSAGGISGDLHLFYDQENLFHNVIIQSGTSLGYMEIQEPDDEVPLKIAAHLGFSTANVDEAIKFLATADTDLVIAAGNELNFRYRPCIEYEFENVENFILEYPINLNIRRNIPVLVGFNEDEALALVNRDPTLSYIENVIYDLLGPVFTFDSSLLKEMEELVRHFYIGGQTSTEEQLNSIIRFKTDFEFAYPTQRIIQKYFREGVRTIYHYMFSYSGQRNSSNRRGNGTMKGAAHSDELGYLFDDSTWPEEPSAADQLVIDRMTSMWTNFVKYSNPTPQADDLLPIIWMPVTEDKLYYLNIDSDNSLKTRPLHDRMAFWDLFYKLNEKYQREYKEANP